MKHSKTSKNKNFGQHLKAIRLKKGITLGTLAEGVDELTKATVSRIENGIVDPKLSTLIKIADSLDISVSDLLNY